MHGFGRPWMSMVVFVKWPMFIYIYICWSGQVRWFRWSPSQSKLSSLIWKEGYVFEFSLSEGGRN